MKSDFEHIWKGPDVTMPSGGSAVNAREGGADDEPRARVVLVGTYKGDQLTRWHGWYNYPISDKDDVDETNAEKINELWLFKGKKDLRTYKAEFVGVKTRQELIDDYGYPAAGKAHGEKYLLFRTEYKYVHKFSKAEDAERVVIRMSDFATAPKVRKQLKAYLESSERQDPDLAKRLPEIITRLRPRQLRVCEAAVQLSFWDIPDLVGFNSEVPFPPPKNPRFTFIDLFAGMGGFRLAMEAQGGKCVFSSEWNKYAQKTYEANFGEKPYGDITKAETKNAIPKYFDVLCAGFPCQPFSIAGISKKKSLGRETGFKDKTQGTLFFDVADIISRHRPKAFFLENVKNLLSHDKGNTFKVIRETLEELDYSIHYRVMDGQEYVPQHRERIMIVGFDRRVYRNAENFNFPRNTGKKHVLADILENKIEAKYTLSDKLWNYLQNYALKHQEKGNGFGFGMASLDGVSRTLSARYYKDGSEILIPQGTGCNPRRLTPRECARLMGYPDNYRIDAVSDIQAYKQCGNSVVVPLVTAVAHNLIESMFL